RSIAAQASPYRDVCGKCGARRIDRQIGLEPTLDAYVETMVGVFREVRRVLKPSGTAWLNLGDSYASASGIKTVTPQTAYTTGRAGGNARGAPKKSLEYEASLVGF